MVRFSASPKNEPHSPPSRERSEREMQKTLLGYAHPSLRLFKSRRLGAYKYGSNLRLLMKRICTFSAD
ncbi:MAG: hypothetical protein U5L45_26890 [Saprospiraceae bacterium]|nr:hypothetical protein [Saprospiraceae bacterium]